MPAKRLSMRKIKDVLRLKWGQDMRNLVESATVAASSDGELEAVGGQFWLIQIGSAVKKKK